MSDIPAIPQQPVHYEMNIAGGELFKALAKAQAVMGTAKKTAKNPFFKSNYADLFEITEERRAIHKFGLSLTQHPIGTCQLLSILGHESGEYIMSIFEMAPVKKDPQGVGSANTYARRYSTQSILGIPTEDDDGNEASRPSKPAKAPPVTLYNNANAGHKNSLMEIIKAKNKGKTFPVDYMKIIAAACDKKPIGELGKIVEKYAKEFHAKNKGDE